ncbi:MAG TPA: GIY-YIG nuclease family protein [Hypericibacter adhaerens]|jgi:hypothetical protein|uniref:GIY-YIG nuclease family protein n=1 Tax=Hypericibacter adhaerens TaxID=2602016 RepID=UPI002C03FAE7|nr:GIY-YIG nuclease family protein [Hypericibacter adhaerens]HWA43726.1 GIY-YIG nuclease family protein [Hypericibacter adhaerens]
MLTFNQLLRGSDIDPDHVKLVRHQDRRASARLSPYELWRTKPKDFEIYQRIQRRPVFSEARVIASFVASPLNQTLFVGLYRVVNYGEPPRQLRDPISGVKVGGSRGFYDLRPLRPLKDLRGRLVIDWGYSYRAWVQRASRQDKPILELARDRSDPPFPGFMDFSWPVQQLNDVPRSWRETLSSIGGIYALVSLKSGQIYVGQARGRGGFWSRWQNYRATGHGGNIRMKLLPDEPYRVSLLEFASSSTDANTLHALENRWKEKLLSRKFGLNDN